MSAHEAGHAVVGTAVGCLIPGSSRPEQLSIVARSGGALGFTYIPPGEEDRKLMFSDELRGRLVTLMGGRAAEIVACGRVSTGALDDIQRATDLAYKSVAEYGLSPSIGPMSVGTLSAGGQEDAMFGSGMADDANKQVETEVKATLTSALWIAVGLVTKVRNFPTEHGKRLRDCARTRPASWTSHACEGRIPVRTVTPPCLRIPWSTVYPIPDILRSTVFPIPDIPIPDIHTAPETDTFGFYNLRT